MRRGRPLGAAAVLVVSAWVGVATTATTPAAGSPAGATTPELAAALADLAPGETTTVLVTLAEQADLPDLPDATRRARLRAVVDALQDSAAEVEAPLQDRLDVLAGQGAVEDATPLWVLNAVSVTATAEVVQELAARPDVAAVEPDPVRIVPAAVPAEPNQTAIHAPDVWDLGDTGQGVVVATLDSGVDGTHPDLAGRWRGGTNSWFDPYGEHPTTPTDLTGHGTATMGVVLGGDAGGTTIGTAPGATWIAARIFDDRGAATTTAVHQAFQWLLDPDHDPTTADAPQVVNGSWSIGSGPGCDLGFQPDVQALRAAGILPVFAAGNFGPGASTSVSPANYPESLAVGAVSSQDLVYGASSRGPSDCGGRTGVFPDVVAPGVDIRTTDRYGLYQTTSGTSIAAPHVAGTLALLLHARPGLSADEQQAALASGAVDLGPAGPDNDYGAGRIDALASYRSLTAPAPDFSLTATPAATTVAAGSPATYDVQVAPVNGFTGDVSLAVSGAPGPATFTPAVVTGGSGAARLVVTPDRATVPGTYPMTITGTSGATGHGADVTLTVTPPPPTDPLELSLLGNVNPPGVAGAADDADLYTWDGTAFRRTLDLSAVPYRLGTGADVDGFERVDASHFLVSFRDNTSVPGLGTVQDEDVVGFGPAGWTMVANLTAKGLTAAGQDVDAFRTVGTTLFFSTAGNVNPPGVRGTADDSDVYSWDGRAFARVWDATAHGVPAAANVDGLDGMTGPTLDAGVLYLSFAADLRLPGLAPVQDEDVVALAGGTWSVYFDGTARGLTGDARDVDAFDVP